LFARLLEGERKVKLTVQPETSAGKITVRLKRAEISGVPLSGILLSLAAKLVLSRVYEETEIDAPFEMGHNIDHAVIDPKALTVFIKK
jgi:membrane protein involved in colicin uptake